MKQKAKIYKSRRIVIGDKNLVTKNEIHVNDIPQEGGESGGGDTSSWKFLDLTNLGDEASYYIEMAMMVKYQDAHGTHISFPLSLASGETGNKLLAIAWDEMFEITTVDGKMLYKDVVAQLLPSLLQSGAKEISKKEFYNI